MRRHVEIIATLALALWVTGGMGQACGLDGIPSLQIDGRLVALNRTPPTAGHLATWVPFVAMGAYRAGQPVRFTEMTGRVLWTLPPSAFKRPWRWTFGDGGQAHGLRATHIYRRPGTYVVRARAYVRDGKDSQWFTFDAATIRIS